MRPEHPHHLALRRLWLEGRIHAGLGDLDLVRTAFEEVRSPAAREETATGELVREIVQDIERTRNNPYDRFEPSTRRS